MGKILAGNFDCEILNDIFSENENMIGFRANYNVQKSLKTKSLTSCVTQFNLSGGEVFINYELSNSKVYDIALRLARAIDENSTNDIKYLKQKYAKQKEFLVAKDYLNQQAKKIWDVFEKDYDKSKVPIDAMKVLGITNRPSLEFLLLESLIYFEKDNGTTTVDIISSILNNKNLDYNIDEICVYLKSNKTKIKYNSHTTKYLIEKLNYNSKKLSDIGVDFDFGLAEKLKYGFIILKNTCKKAFVWL